LLAPYVGFEAVQHLVTGHEPDVSVLGMVCAYLAGGVFLGLAGNPPLRLVVA
jgi:hypothetical protein